MDYQTLRSELLAGSRLPNPTYSPPKISHLIQTCWLADPKERPTFTKIQEQLLQSCRALTLGANKESHCYLTLVTSDNTMQAQYNQIQQCNPTFEKKFDDNQETAVEGSSAQISGRSDPYLDVQSSERSLLTELNSIPNQSDDMLNYVETTKDYADLEVFDEP